MLRNVFLKTLRDMRGALAWWAIGLGLMCLWFVTFFPAISGASGLQEYMESLPESFLAVFGVSETMIITTLAGFLTLELMSAWLPGLTIAFGVAFGAGLLSREEDEGSLDLLLANPVPRWRVALEKFAALVVFTVIVALACWVGLLLGVVAIDVEAGDVRLLDGMVSLAALTLFFAALTYCLTCLKRGRGLATGVGAGLAVVTFFTNNLADLANLPEWSRRLSPWYYYGGNTILADGLNWGHFGLLIGLTVLLVALGVWGFSQRDLGT